MNHDHHWIYTTYYTDQVEAEFVTLLAFVCDCGAMKKVRGFDFVEPEKKRIGRPPKNRDDTA